ncbi:MAG: 4-phosphopantetheinyl transferase, partial [Lachnospiraceae bacterium]|nr:4-phosphopantetheinyl transferase [Lachnospiraceae bacterium]
MVRTYVVNIRKLEEETFFQAALPSVSSYRRQKIEALKNGKDRCRSLGASLALNAALQFYGLCERTMEYDLESQGKPMLRDYPALHFSLSHAGDYAIC